MGERQSIRIETKYGEAPIYLYAHWHGGGPLDGMLADALDNGRGRWGDDSYLTRIIFSRMVRDDIDGETGFGISTYQVDANYPDIVVDMDEQTVDGRSFEDYISWIKAKV